MTKMVKKLQNLGNILFIIGITLICLTACEKNTVEGQSEVEKAREDFSKLHSGVVEVWNVNTNEIEQTLTFKYDEVGILLYSLTGVSEGEPYEQYCNGYETYTFENGEVTKVSKGNVNYDAYTYDFRYPMTDDEYLYFVPAKVVSANKSEDENGVCYSYEYEPSVINGEDNLGELTYFSVNFYFDENDTLTHFEECSEYQKDGETTQYHYKMVISQRDSVGKVAMPENIKKLTESAGK